MTRWPRGVAGVVVVAAGVGCAPELVDEPWRVSQSRVLAIASDPPEARPGTSVALTALVVDADGEVASAPQWSLCTRPRTGEERTGVTQACLEGSSLQSTSAIAQVLPDACARFGPNPPPAEAGFPPQRPADPDQSGGYFLPVRAVVESAEAQAFGAIRLRCDLPGVTRAIFDAYQERYLDNTAPTIAAVQLDGSADPSVRAGTDVAFSVELASGAAESFVVYDAAAGVLEERRETLRVHWFVVDGELDRGQAEIIADGSALRAQTTWTTPLEPGPTPVWVVVTDERGASVWVSLSVDITP